MDMKQLAGCHRVQDIEKSLLIRLEQEEFAPEPLGRRRIIEGVIIDEHIEKMKVKLNNLGFEVVRPELLCQGRGRVHGGRSGA